MIIKGKTALGKKNAVRSFLSISIPFGISREIYSHLKIFSSEDRNLIYTNVEKYHITLQFLGDEVKNDSLNEIVEKLTPVIHSIQSPLIETEELHFGHKSQIIPTVLFLGIIPSVELLDITREIHYAIKSIGLPDIKKEKDYKKLIYHITLARAKHHVSRSFGRNINNIIRNDPIKTYLFNAPDISILNSSLSIKGQKYTEYASIKFASLN